MGLDISVYQKLVAAPNATLDEDGYPDDDKFVVIDKGTIDWTEDHWPGRTNGITAGVYAFTERAGFRAGSYSGYNRWRAWLARVSGHGTPDAVWSAAKPTGPFVELINFADNEGIIGPVVSAKLAKDFAENEDRIVAMADADDDTYNIEMYRQWRKAFEMAADGGCVNFH